MKIAAKWISFFVFLLLLAGCASKETPIYKLISLYQQKKYDEAIEFAEKLTAKNPDDSQAYRFLVRSVIAKDELEKYRDKYTQLTQQNPKVAGYHFALGYVETQLKNFDPAIAELQKAIEVNPAIEYSHYVLGWIYLNPNYAASDSEKGLAEWAKEEKMNPNSLGALQVYADRAKYYLKIGNADAAEKDYEKITLHAFAPGDITAARSVITRIQELRDELAKTEAEVKANPENAEANLKLGVLQYNNGRLKDAIATWQNTVKLDPNNAELRNYFGKALFENVQYGESAKQLRKAIELDPKLMTAYYNLAVAEDLSGEPKKAIEHYKKYIELNPMAPKLDEVKKRITTLEKEAAPKKKN